MCQHSVKKIANQLFSLKFQYKILLNFSDLPEIPKLCIALVHITNVCTFIYFYVSPPSGFYIEKQGK